jgi:hypothetical protein
MKLNPKNNNPMKDQRIIMAIAFIAVSMIFSSCRKDISLPDPSLSKLFGSWEWVQTSGGLAGQIKNPATEGQTQSVEFSSTGIYKLFINGEQKSKTKYSLSYLTAVHNADSPVLVTYENLGSGHQSDDIVKQYLTFKGEDTLYLNDECVDCFNYVYVRK